MGAAAAASKPTEKLFNAASEFHRCFLSLHICCVIKICFFMTSGAKSEAPKVALCPQHLLPCSQVQSMLCAQEHGLDLVSDGKPWFPSLLSLVTCKFPSHPSSL